MNKYLEKCKMIGQLEHHEHRVSDGPSVRPVVIGYTAVILSHSQYETNQVISLESEKRLLRKNGIVDGSTSVGRTNF